MERAESSPILPPFFQSRPREDIEDNYHLRPTSAVMPRRRSTTAPLATKPKVKNRKLKRGLNALAIAEQQNPTQIKIRSNRLGEIEERVPKRKGGGGYDTTDVEDESRKSKRRKDSSEHRLEDGIEVGSDSDGNEWVVGRVNSDDDSDLDSDEAMGESDEDRFESFTFRGSTAQKSRKKPRAPGVEDKRLQDTNLHINQNPQQASDDDLGDDAIDLAAMLDAGDNDTEDSPSMSSVNSGDDVGSEIRDFDADTESSMENEDSVLSVSDNENDDTSPAKLASLQALVSNMDNKNSNKSQNHDMTRDAHESTVPSEFGLTSAKKLTVADLIPSITDPQLKKSLKLLADNEFAPSSKRGGIPKKLEVPLAKRQQDRLDRAAAYLKSKETLDRWIDTVKNNRRAEHLSFPLQDPDAVAAPGKQRIMPKIQSQPLPGLETAIQNILQDSGLASTKPSSEDQSYAFGELPTKKLSLDEVQARRAELRRARDLLFREESRAKRIKRIKSKSYRRVHRKERERNSLAVGDFDGSESEQDRNDRRRAEERMGARHRESRWARGVKESGRAAWDEDARSGVTEMARRGEELKRRIDGLNVALHNDESSPSYSDSDIVEDEAEDETQTSVKKPWSRLDKLNKDDEMLGSGILGPESGISSLKFMKNAEALRKARNDEEVEVLRRELAGEDTPSEDNIEGPGRRSYGPIDNSFASKRVSKQREQKSEFEEILGSDTDRESFQGFDEENEQEIIVDRAAGEEQNVSRAKTSGISGNKSNSGGSTKKSSLETHENPWLSSNKLSKTGSRKARDSQANAIISNNLTAGDSKFHNKKPISHSLMRGSTLKKGSKVVQSNETSVSIQNSQSEDEDEATNRLPFVMRNQDLVRRAFAGDEVVADFEKEKQKTIHDEEEKMIDDTLPGWGSWTGAGINKKNGKSHKGKVLVKVDGIRKEKRQDAKLDRVIINEKRVKKVCDAQTH